MQRPRLYQYAALSILYLCVSMAHAETNYVIDELETGLHQNRTTDSPILKLVPSGTALTILERDNDLVQVQEPEGVKGWVNSKYLVNKKPGRAQVNELEKQNAALQKEIELLKSKVKNVSTTASPSAENNDSKELEQQLKSERLKAGELQAQLTDLKARIPSIGGSDKKLLEEIEQLKEENNSLITQLESAGVEVMNQTGSTTFSLSNWKNITLTFLIIFVLGMAGGAYVLDYFNRRRHGGFRV